LVEILAGQGSHNRSQMSSIWVQILTTNIEYILELKICLKFYHNLWFFTMAE